MFQRTTEVTQSTVNVICLYLEIMWLFKTETHHAERNCHNWPEEADYVQREWQFCLEEEENSNNVGVTESHKEPTTHFFSLQPTKGFKEI